MYKPYKNMSLSNSPLFEIKPEVIKQIFSIASVCDDVRVPEEQNVLHMSSWKAMWVFNSLLFYMNYGEKASGFIKAFTWWFMKLWMAQTWYCNICTWDWCNSGPQSRIWSHVGKDSCKIQNTDFVVDWMLLFQPLTYSYVPTERMFMDAGFVFRRMLL